MIKYAEWIKEATVNPYSTALPYAGQPGTNMQQNWFLEFRNGYYNLIQLSKAMAVNPDYAAQHMELNKILGALANWGKKNNLMQ